MGVFNGSDDNDRLGGTNSADQIWGMDVVVATTAKTDEEARALLGALNFPFRQ